MSLFILVPRNNLKQFETETTFCVKYLKVTGRGTGGKPVLFKVNEILK